MIITIDSNLINSKQKDEVMNQLEEYANNNELQIVGAQRLIDEMENHSSKASEKADNYENISEPFTVGYSAIGSFYISGDEENPEFHEIAKILFPNLNTEDLNSNKINDVMHLIAHHHSNSEYFVTRDTDFIDENKTNANRHKDLKNLKRDRLEEFGIIVKRPEEILKMLSKS